MHITRTVVSRVSGTLAVVAVGAFGLVAGQAATAAVEAGGATAAKPSASLVYHGMDADKVGFGNNARPDSTKDGHFTITLTTDRPRTVTNIEINSQTGGVWDTLPQGSFAVLGVFRDGKRLNSRDQAIRNHVTGKVVYEVYAADNVGYLKNVSKTVAKITFSDGITVTSSTATVKVNRPTGPTASVAFHGMDADKVGTGNTAAPDGALDGHFTIILNVEKPRTVTNIEINSQTGGVWDTLPQGNFAVLGVYRDGKRLNPTDGAISNRVTGTVVYEVYAADSVGYLKDVSKTVAKITFNDQTTVTSSTATKSKA